MLRVDVFAGGVEHVEEWSPAQMVQIVERTEAVQNDAKKRNIYVPCSRGHD